MFALMNRRQSCFETSSPRQPSGNTEDEVDRIQPGSEIQPFQQIDGDGDQINRDPDQPVVDLLAGEQELGDEAGHCGESVEIGEVCIRPGVHDVAPDQGKQDDGPYDGGQVHPGQPGDRETFSGMVRVQPVDPAIGVQSDVKYMQDSIRVQAGHKKDVNVDGYGNDTERPGDDLLPGQQPDMDQSGDGGDQFERVHPFDSILINI